MQALLTVYWVLNWRLQLKNLYDSISAGGLGSGVSDGGIGGSGGGSYSGGAA